MKTSSFQNDEEEDCVWKNAAQARFIYQKKWSKSKTYRTKCAICQIFELNPNVYFVLLTCNVIHFSQISAQNLLSLINDLNYNLIDWFKLTFGRPIVLLFSPMFIHSVHFTKYTRIYVCWANPRLLREQETPLVIGKDWFLDQEIPAGAFVRI